MQVEGCVPRASPRLEVGIELTDIRPITLHPGDPGVHNGLEVRLPTQEDADSMT